MRRSNCNVLCHSSNFFRFLRFPVVNCECNHNDIAYRSEHLHHKQTNIEPPTPSVIRYRYSLKEGRLEAVNSTLPPISLLMEQSNIKPLKTSRDIPVCIVKQAPVGIDKDGVGFGDLLPQVWRRRIVGEVLGTVLERESFVRPVRMSVSMYIVVVRQLVSYSLTRAWMSAGEVSGSTFMIR
jgi:hypothetical protein